MKSYVSVITESLNLFSEVFKNIYDPISCLLYINMYQDCSLSIECPNGFLPFWTQHDYKVFNEVSYTRGRTVELTYFPLI